MKNQRAFPVSGYYQEEGMTLRDYFAAKAVNGFCANPETLPTRQDHFDNLAEDAYRVADAMLAERNKEVQP